MDFVGILILMSLASSWGFQRPVDTVIVQVQSWGAVNAQQLKGQVLLNGASLTATNQEIDGIIRGMSVDKHLPDVMGVNLTSVLRTCIVLRSRECILEGLELHWTDRVFCDGKVYLTLERNDTWAFHVPEAAALKVLWDQEVERTREERIRLQEGCPRLMRELGLSTETSDPVTILPQYVIPILCVLAFIGLVVMSILLSKTLGLKHPGGVIGSMIHYPQDMTEMTTKENGCIYSTL